MEKPDGEITKSLSRNHTREEVLLYMADIGDSTTYLTEISNELDKAVSSVFRAINTQGETKGLRDLGLIEKTGDFMRLSEKGKEVARYIKQAPRARNGAKKNEGKNGNIKNDRE